MHSSFFSRFLVLSTAVLSLSVLLSCQKKAVPEQTEPIRIGVFQSISGPDATFGQDAMKGIRMAEQEINSHGGVLGRPIELIIRDNQSKPGETSSIVRELISRYHVVALIGEVASSRTLEAAPIAQRFGIPLVANSATNDKITQAGNFVFRVSYRDSHLAEVLAQYMYSLGKRHPGLLVDISKDNTTTVAKSFKKKFIALGGQIVAEQNFSAGDREFSPQLTALKNSGADCYLFLGYYTDCGVMLKQARSLGLKMDIFGSDGWDSSDLVRVAGDSSEGAIFPTSFSAEDPDPAVQSFVQLYQQKYGEKPATFTATGFDALTLVADAIRRAGNTTPQAIRDALANTTNFPGVCGKISYDKSRDPSKSIVFIKVENGKFSFLSREGS